MRTCSLCGEEFGCNGCPRPREYKCLCKVCWMKYEVEFRDTKEQIFEENLWVRCWGLGREEIEALWALVKSTQVSFHLELEALAEKMKET